jgi:hypothetical protein
MEETWKDIVGYENLYQISNYGRIKSLLWKVEKFLALINHTNGYKQVNLSKDGNIKKGYVHRLVAEAFIPNPENKPEINHIDGDKSNNNVSNLEWVTRKENVKHEFDTGLGYVPNLKGENHGSSKLTNSQVIDIYLSYHKDGVRIYELAKKFNIGESAIALIVKGKSWKHITKELL